MLGDSPSTTPTKRPNAKRGPSPLEESFRRQATAHCIPEWVEEHRFDAVRKWRFDFAWPSRMLAVEVEGGTHSGGRHTRGAGYAADCEKYNAATISGWRVLRFTGDHLNDKRGDSPAMVQLRRAMEVFAENP
jgi:very-short-patch-repair endonuclease